MTTKISWAKALSKGLIDIRQLQKHEFIDTDDRDELKNAGDIFDIRVPEIFLDQIKAQNPALKKQFIPTKEELIFLPEELTDPIGDEPNTPVEGITHRYPNRVLLKPTYLCASYCRFCFRRYKVSNSDHNLTDEQYVKCLEYLKSHQEIWEVILTGGDPLVLNDKKILQMMNDLASIKHIKVLRFHTRVPSVLPERITKELIQALKTSNKSLWIALHVNHADEFTPKCREVVKMLIESGISVVLQSVLLKGVNNSYEVLKNLFESAVEQNIKPYYLHFPDLAKGTGHFRMSLEEAQNLFASLRGNLSGICLPQFILDIPGGKGKISAEKSRILLSESGALSFDSPLKNR